jgi:hypothetical protein
MKFPQAIELLIILKNGSLSAVSTYLERDKETMCNQSHVF